MNRVYRLGGIASYGGVFGGRLARYLNVPHWKPKEGKLLSKPRKNRMKDSEGRVVIINYGCSSSYFEEAPPNVTVLNRKAEVARSKLQCFEAWQQFTQENDKKINHPELVNPNDREGVRLARKDKLSQGRGIQVLQPGEKPTVPYDFIVRYTTLLTEYRVHVFKGRFVLAAEKMVENREGVRIGNFHAGGVVFRQVLMDALPRSVWIQSARAVRALELDWAAVDVGLTLEGKPIVFEVNTAPAILNLPIYRYAKMIAGMYLPDYVLPEYVPFEW